VPRRSAIGGFFRDETWHDSNRITPLPRSSSSPKVFLSFDISILSSPAFFGRTARAIPLRSCLLVFCFHGSSPKRMGPSHKADASLRLHAPSLSLVPQRKRGRKKKVKTKCLIYILSGIAFSAVRSPTVPSLEHGLSSLATPGTEACTAAGGAFRPQWREWPGWRAYSNFGCGFTTNTARSWFAAHHSFHLRIFSGVAAAPGGRGGSFTMNPKTPTTQA
jgi:hypothetical protein